tara:strand:+ start:90 stop:281 length:192 start_codon:yes stop_codon:yes gene_type:complete
VKSYLYKSATGAGAVMGSAPGVLAASDANLTGVITTLLPLIIEVLLVVILMKVIVDLFKGFKV